MAFFFLKFTWTCRNTPPFWMSAAARACKPWNWHTRPEALFLSAGLTPQIDPSYFLAPYPYDISPNGADANSVSGWQRAACYQFSNQPIPDSLIPVPGLTHEKR